jgi:hypothetical protein
MKQTLLFLLCSLVAFSLGCGRKPEKTQPTQWTVIVGTQSREQLFDRLSKSSISEQNENEKFSLLVRDSPEFKISPAREELELVVVTAEQLDLPTARWGQEIPLEEFKAKVAEAGYRLCPHDAIVEFILTVRGHEPLEFTYVATEPITGMHEKQPVMRPLVPVVFTHLGVSYIVMRPLDLIAHAPRRYIVAKPRTSSASHGRRNGVSNTSTFPNRVRKRGSNGDRPLLLRLKELNGVA